MIVWVFIGTLFVVKKYNNKQNELGTFTSPDGTFSTQLPNLWNAQMADQSKWAILVTFVTDAIQTTSNNKPYIHIAKWWVAGDLQAVYTSTLERYQKLFKNYQLVSNADLEIDWQAAKKNIFDWTLGWKLLRYWVVFVPYKDTIYTVTASASLSDFDQVNVALDSIVKDWKFIQ